MTDDRRTQTTSGSTSDGRTETTTDATTRSDGGSMDDTSAVAEELAAYATRLDGVRPTDDLAELHDRFASATVIGLGEATHGSQEFFQRKDRLVRYLVRELGCRAVAFEVTAAHAMDAYVVHGDGDAASALAERQIWPPKVTAARDLLDWLRSFDADRPVDDRVRMYGFDGQ